MIELARELYQQIVESAFPVAFLFGICNLALQCLLKAGLGGRLWLGKD